MTYKVLHLFFSTLIPVILSTPNVKAATAENLREIAESVTVKIRECRRNPVKGDKVGESLAMDNNHPQVNNSNLCFAEESSFMQVGSGTIIASQGDIYYLLTAKHVVSSIKNTPYAAIPFESSEMNKLSLVRDKMGLPLLWESDMALLSFKSKEVLDPVTLYTGCVFEDWSQLSIEERSRLGISVKGSLSFSRLCHSLEQLSKNQESVEDTPQILIAGYPISQGKHIPLLISLGSFIDRDSKSLKLQTPVTGGYEFLYNAVTEKGMSGGPILDTDGRLIGIHGVTDGEPVSNLSFGYGLGIPIDFFLNRLADNLNTNYELNLMTFKTADLLPQKGRGLVMIASIDNSYYIRIFNKSGEKYIDLKKNFFENNSAFIRKLDWAFDHHHPLNKQQKDDILREITEAIGNSPSILQLLHAEYISAHTTPSSLSSDDISILLNGKISNCLLENEADDGDQFIEYGSRLVRLGNYHEALSCFELASSIDPASPLPLYGKAMIFLRLANEQNDTESQKKNLITAKLFLEEALTISDNRQKYIFQYNLGLIYLQLEKYKKSIQAFEKAIIDYRAAISEDSEYLQAWAAKAIALNHLGKVNEASVAQNIAGSDLTGYRAIISRGNGLYESSIQKIKEGDSEIAKQMLDEANTAFDKAKNHTVPSTNRSEIWLGKGKVQTTLRNYTEAKQSLENSINIEKKYTLEILETVFKLTKIDLKNSLEWGSQIMRKALENDKNNYIAWYYSGVLLSLDTNRDYASRYEEAYTSCKMSVSLKKNFQQGVECLDRMQVIIADIQLLEKKCEERSIKGKNPIYTLDFSYTTELLLPVPVDEDSNDMPDVARNLVENFGTKKVVMRTQELGRVSVPSGSNAKCQNKIENLLVKSTFSGEEEEDTSDATQNTVISDLKFVLDEN